MLIDKETLETVSSFTGIGRDRLQRMYDGLAGPKPQLLAHALCSVPASFYDELAMGRVNKVCDIFECMSHDSQNQHFGGDLMGRFRRSRKYAGLIVALENMPVSHVDNCIIALTALSGRRHFFVSTDTAVSDLMRSLEEEADDDGESGNV